MPADPQDDTSPDTSSDTPLDTSLDRAFDPAQVLAALTTREKASLCLGSDFWHTAPVQRVGVPAVTVSDGPHGLRRQPEGGDHVGIGGSLPATCFPTASALGSSWDPGLARRVGAAVGREARAQGVAVVLGPGINIKRSPLCGRNFEYLSEDPLLSGVLGAALTEGIQGQGVGACVKHFAANNQETDRVRVSAEVDERTLREIYLPSFERVVRQARPWTVMCAYNRLNGTYASQHHWLLTELLRDEWGFEGMVMSDWGAVADRVAALAAGLDLEMPPNLGVSDARIVAAVESGELAEKVLDTAVARVLAVVAAAPDPHGPAFDVDEHHRLAREVAAQCAVLLKNDGGLLPLAPAAGTTVAVVGEFAWTPRYQGAGSSQVNPTRLDEPLAELRAAVPDGVEVAFAPGFGLEPGPGDAALADAAVELAGRAAVVVAYLGLPGVEESEGFDRTRLDLPANQLALLPRLAAANPDLVVVLANGGAVEVAGIDRHARALLECWLGGQAAGGAVADLLLGRAEPAGRLAESLALRLEDHPSTLNFPGELGRVRYGEGVFVGYRGLDRTRREVSYPFGHGLSYTSFRFDGLTAEVGGSGSQVTVTATLTVTNTGERRGAEVVQLYVGAPEASVARPPRELRGFEKVWLEPGETRAVTFLLHARDLSYWSPRAHGWTLEPGRYVLEAGPSSRDLPLRAEVTVAAPPVGRPLDVDSTLEEWLADPDGRQAVQRVAGRLLADPELVRVIGNFPLSRLAAFPGFGITTESLGALLTAPPRP